MLEGYKERKAQIGRAAVENCVEEQMVVNDCYEKGQWKDRLTMCRRENRAFERCYIMQSVGSTFYAGAIHIGVVDDGLLISSCSGE